MEDIKVKEFLSIGYGYGCGSGDRHGFMYGFGDGKGRGYSEGYFFILYSGDGYGKGDGTGYAFGTGTGAGGDGSYPDGTGKGDGDGSDIGVVDAPDDGSGLFRYGIKSIHGLPICLIDGIQTTITSIKGNIAKGEILHYDLTTTPCFIVKQDDKFAHGKTLREAQAALIDKLFNDKPLGEKIDDFVNRYSNGKVYTAREFYDWHGRLTGSCPLGREQFVCDRGLDLNSSMTVTEFIQLSENEYGRDIIKVVKARYM